MTNLSKTFIHLDDLMGTDDEIDVESATRGDDHVLAEDTGASPTVLLPSDDPVLGIGPEEIHLQRRILECL
jgi:hypothetical protein